MNIFVCPLCEKKLPAEAANCEFVLPCGCTWAMLKPNKLVRENVREAKFYEGCDRVWTAVGHGVTKQHPIRETAVAQWLAEAKIVLRRTQLIVVTKTVVVNQTKSPAMARESKPEWAGDISEHGAFWVHRDNKYFWVWRDDPEIVVHRIREDSYAAGYYKNPSIAKGENSLYNMSKKHGGFSYGSSRIEACRLFANSKARSE